MRMGYSVEEGPEIEQDYYNFECLNLALRTIRPVICEDSFYITRTILLRTHTSLSARTLRKQSPIPRSV